MEGLIDKNRVFEILIEDIKSILEKDMSNEKKKEIIEFLSINNEICSNKEYQELKNMIQLAYKQGDLELLKILLSKKIDIDSVFEYKINQNNKTASLYKIKQLLDNLIVPKTIKYNSEDYSITSIINSGSYSTKKIKNIEFMEGSAVQTIYNDSFIGSPIESLFIPEGLVELKEGWCAGTEKLNNIVVSSKNNRFSFKEDKYLVYKSDVNNDDYDVLLFARRDIKEINIPSNIKIISSYAFESCNDLTKVTIEQDSKLQKIGKCAFKFSKINSICFPPSLLEICQDAFYMCFNLSTVEFPQNSNLKIIGKNAFICAKMTEILIPSNVLQINEGAFTNCSQLQKIEIPPDSQLQTIDKNAFFQSIIQTIYLPINISKICENAFYYCEALRKVEIPSNSKIQTIEKFAFHGSPIESLFIPEGLVELEEGWCAGTEKLNNIVVSSKNNRFSFKEDKYLVYKSDVNNDDYDVLLFARRDIKEINIPSNIKIISSYAFESCVNLQKVEIRQNSSLQTIGEFAFSNTSIETIYIPESLVELKEGWCSEIEKLKNIIVSPKNNRFILTEDKCLVCKKDENSENNDILLFAPRNFEQISIPSSIKIISPYTFYSCKNIRKINIPINSHLQTISKFAFSRASIKTISIPKTVSFIDECAFTSCEELQNIEIPLNLDIQTIERHAFSFTNIKSFYIPPNVSIIREASFTNCKKLRNIEIPKNSKLKIIEDFAFAHSAIEKVSIPSSVSKICYNAFYFCLNLSKVDFSPNSNLQIIKENAFTNIPINSIIIPSSVTIIEKSAFERCLELKIVEISKESKLFSIDPMVFDFCRNIFIMIPARLKDLAK